MKKSIFITLLLPFLLLSSCDVLEQASGALQFTQCDFSIENVGMEKLGDIMLKEIKSPSDIDPIQAVLLVHQMNSGNLPVTMEVNIQASNNHSSQKAAISGLDWELFMKNKSYTSGKINREVEVLPGQSTVFPVSVSFDLLELMSGSSLEQILELVLNINDREKLQQLDLQIQLKPYYKVGTQIQEYPGYITIRPV